MSCHGNRTFIAAGVFPVERGDKAKLLFTDTDSLTYEIKTEDVHEGFSIDSRINLTTVIPKRIVRFMRIRQIRRSSVISNNLQRLIVGLIKELIGLRSKMYHIGGFQLPSLKFKLENY